MLWLRYRTVYIPKVDKTGQCADAEDPNNYRAICVGNTLLKAFGLVVTRRLSHWAVAHKLISPAQVGFMCGHSAEEHVFTVTEAIRHRWRRGQATYALFVDFKKAYDRVHPEALWLVLRRMGVPEALVALLADWSARRETVVVTNGVESDPIRMAMGVGQGDVLSPLLFNLFIESLARHLERSAAGVELISGGNFHPRGGPLRLTLRALLYADDVVVLAPSRAAAQTALGHVRDWASVWGLELGDGALKTAAMAFPVPGRGVPAPLPQALPFTRASVNSPELTADEERRSVPFVQCYKYLGLWLWPDLSEKVPPPAGKEDEEPPSRVASLVATMRANWNRYFVRNRLVYRAAPAFALQIFRTVVLGAGNYLLSLTYPSSDVCKAIDAFAKEAVRTISGFGKRDPAQALWSEGRISSASAVLARERTRLHLRLLNPVETDREDGDVRPPMTTLAARVYQLVRAERVARDIKPCKRRPPATHSWAWWVKDLHTRHAEQYGVSVPTPKHPSDVPRAAAVYGRALDFAVWRATGLKTRPPNMGAQPGAAPEPVTYDSRPPTGPPLATLAWLNLEYRQTPSDLDERRNATPLSVRGPGCSGSILAAVSVRLSRLAVMAINNLRLGKQALFRRPLAPVGRTHAAVQTALAAGQTATPWKDLVNTPARAAAGRARRTPST